MPRSIGSSLLVLLLASAASFAGSSPAERLAEAVRIKTVSHYNTAQIDYAEFERFHAFLRAAYPRVFSQLQVEVISDYSLMISWPGTDSALQPILFLAHMDVVPVEPGTEQDWQHPAFAGVLADGRIYGRGTLDDKQGLLGLMEAAETLLAEGFTPRRTIMFAFGHDEEISGKVGAVSIARRMRELGLHFEWMVDEGGMVLSDSPVLPGRPMAMVNVAEKGYLTLTLVATGDGGHSSSPPRASTIGRLSAALSLIESNPFPPRLVGPVESMLETLGPYAGQPERFVFANLWLTGGFVADRMAEDRLTQPLVRTTVALTTFNAGVKDNVIPQRAEAKVNVRLLPGDTPDTVVQRIKALINDPLIAISEENWGEMPPVSDHEAEGFRVIAAAVESVYPEVVVTPSLLFATTDTRHYLGLADNQYRFHGVMMASSQAKSIHGTDEYVDVDSYEKSIEVARQMMLLGARHAP